MIFKAVGTFDVDMVDLKMSNMEYLICLGFSYYTRSTEMAYIMNLFYDFIMDYIYIYIYIYILFYFSNAVEIID